jgi:hypothetical protein
MSPPEVWGPAVWTLFHTLIEKLNPNAYPYVIPSMFNIIKRICQFLPCPDCSKDASNFLAKLKLSDYKTKDEFKNMLYLFHNWVSAKKRKPLFNYSFMDKYSKLNLVFVINNFIVKYNTKGNMKLLTESFQRGFVIKELLLWFKTNSPAFIQPFFSNIVKENIIDQPIITEESEQLVITEAIDQPIITEEIEQTIEEIVQQPIITEEIEQTIEEIVQQPIITEETEQTTEEIEQTTDETEQNEEETEDIKEIIIEEKNTKSKKSKKSKSKK